MRLEGDSTPNKSGNKNLLRILSCLWLTLEVPSSFGSSLFFKAPAPMLGREAERTTIFPPIGDYKDGLVKTHRSFRT